MFALLGPLILKLGMGLIGFATKKSDAAVETLRIRMNGLTEQQKIAAQVTIAEGSNRATLIQTAMGYRWFWIPWSMATVPMAFWFGAGMLDTAFNGALPDVARIPPGLEAWARQVWDSLFYSGAAAAVGQGISAAATKVGGAVVAAVEEAPRRRRLFRRDKEPSE